MKIASRLLSCVLALSLLLSCTGMSVFAADEASVKQYDSMVSLGTSISRGYGLIGYDSVEYDVPDYETYLNGLEGSYPTMVADACGVSVENRYFCDYQGLTLSTILTVLGLEDEANEPLLMGDTRYPRVYYPAIKHYFGEGGKYQLSGENGTLATSDLIVLELGASDIFYRAKILSGIEEVITGEDASADTTEAVEKFIAELYNGYNYVLNNYGKLLDYIQQNNPDADVVVVGMYNMVSGLTLTDDTLLPIGEVVTAITASMNQYLSDLAGNYGYQFADISNTPTPAIEQEMSLSNSDFFSDMNYYIHPSVDNGLPYIGRQVLNVLPEQEEPNTNIVVDLGRFQRVNYVMVDGKIINDYTMDGYQLTVPCDNGNAKALTVAIVGEDWKVAVQLYQLTYTEGSGYTALRIYGTNNALGTAVKPVKNLFNVGNKIIGSVFGK